MTEREFIDKIGSLAAQDMKQSGILASITVAQASNSKCNNSSGRRCRKIWIWLDKRYTEGH